MLALTQPGWELPVHDVSLVFELLAALPPRSLLSTSARCLRCTDSSNEMNWFFNSFSYSSSSRRANSSTSSSDNSLTRLSISSYNSHSAALDMFSMPATSHSTLLQHLCHSLGCKDCCVNTLPLASYTDCPQTTTFTAVHLYANFMTAGKSTLRTAQQQTHLMQGSSFSLQPFCGHELNPITLLCPTAHLTAFNL